MLPRQRALLARLGGRDLPAAGLAAGVRDQLARLVAQGLVEHREQRDAARVRLKRERFAALVGSADAARATVARAPRRLAVVELLAAGGEIAVAALERHGEMSLDPEVRAKLLRMSSATIDRALIPERRRLQVRGRSGTKPGSILKRQIPIRTFAEWDDARPGFCEVDLVSHDGGNPSADHCYTLDLTCVATGWTEMRALKNKAQRWVHEALVDITGTLPFPLAGLDSDNGSEFINFHLFAWCEANEITFTRSRAYRKNDNCFIEQKNWPAVRQQAGYARYDDAEELEALGDLYAHVQIKVPRNLTSEESELFERLRQVSGFKPRGRD